MFLIQKVFACLRTMGIASNANEWGKTRLDQDRLSIRGGRHIHIKYAHT